jgi:RimJ/RimL family protein N-acetyltransferase
MIETERLLLRNWRTQDAEAFERRTNTPAVMQWLGGVKPAEFIHQVITDRLMRWQEELGFTFWAVERKGDGELLGFCGIKVADDVGSPVEGEYEIGWRLREDCWGQGYAKEAASASLDHVFNVIGAERVVALTVQGNTPSWGLMKRLGMTRRPDLDYSGPSWAEGEVIAYMLEKREWIARTS